MASLSTLDLELGARPLRVSVQRVSEVRSRHTGQPLLQLHGRASAPDDAAHEDLRHVLEAAAGQRVRSVEPYDERVRSWRMSWNSYLEAQGVHWYTLILQEEEDLLLEELVIGDLRLHPYEYRETFSGDELTIWAKLVGRKTELLRLRALLKHHPSFPVVRRGIDATPRTMRFGVAEWSEHDGRIKARVVLVDQSADPAEHPELLRIEEQNMRSALAYYMNLADGLATLLEAKGLLTPQEVEALRANAHDTPWQVRQEFWRVPDVDLL